MNSNERYIESLISQGYHPADALASLIGSYDPNFISEWMYLRESYINYPQYNNFRTLFKFNPNFRNLNLSPEFINKWFTYPSELTRTPMKYVGEMPLIDLTDQLVLTPNLEKIIISNSQIFSDEPLFIPVVRYASSGGISDIHGQLHVSRNPDFIEGVYCGTYYFQEPYSDVYLLSNRTLFAPHPDLAYYYLLGEDENALNTLIHQKFTGYDEDVLPRYLDWLRNSMDAWKSGQNITDKLFMTNSIEQELCFLAKNKGIDAIVLMYSSLSIKILKKINEIIDVRSREISYKSLYRQS